MRLGPSLIGAIVGAVVGVAAQIGLESAMGKESTWFAIVIGLLTGLGARAMAGESIHLTSYVRAALAALIGLAAIVGGSYAASEVVRKKNVDAYESATNSSLPSTVSVADDDEGDLGDADIEVDAIEEEGAGDEAVEVDAVVEDAVDDDAGDEAKVEADRDAIAARNARLDLAGIDEARRNKTELPPPSPWQFAFFGIGTFLAYELARGGSKKEHDAVSTED